MNIIKSASELIISPKGEPREYHVIVLYPVDGDQQISNYASLKDAVMDIPYIKTRIELRDDKRYLRMIVKSYTTGYVEAFNDKGERDVSLDYKAAALMNNNKLSFSN